MGKWLPCCSLMLSGTPIIFIFCHKLDTSRTMSPLMSVALKWMSTRHSSEKSNAKRQQCLWIFCINWLVQNEGVDNRRVQQEIQFENPPPSCLVADGLMSTTSVEVIDSPHSFGILNNWLGIPQMLRFRISAFSIVFRLSPVDITWTILVCFHFTLPILICLHCLDSPRATVPCTLAITGKLQRLERTVQVANMFFICKLSSSTTDKNNLSKDESDVCS